MMRSISFGNLASLRRLVLLLSLCCSAVASADELMDNYNAGIRYFKTGQFEKALPHFKRALELSQVVNGRDDANTAPDLNNLGEVYRQLGDYDEAARLFELAIRLDSKTGVQTAALATSLNNLALVYRSQERLDEAEPLYTSSLQILEHMLGPEHPDVARSLNNLSVLYLEQGNRAKALPLAERAARIARAKLGKADASTKLIEETLARAKRPQTQVAAAKPQPRPPQSPPAKPTSGVEQAKAVPSPALAAAIEPAAGPARTAIAPAKPVPNPTAQADGYAIHLASVENEADVTTEWARLRREQPTLADLQPRPPQRIEIKGKGVFWRVLAGNFSDRDAAQKKCAELQGKGGFCGVVRQ